MNLVTLPKNVLNEISLHWLNLAEFTKLQLLNNSTRDCVETMLCSSEKELSSPWEWTKIPEDPKNNSLVNFINWLEKYNVKAHSITISQSGLGKSCHYLPTERLVFWGLEKFNKKERTGVLPLLKSLSSVSFVRCNNPDVTAKVIKDFPITLKYLTIRESEVAGIGLFDALPENIRLETLQILDCDIDNYMESLKDGCNRLESVKKLDLEFCHSTSEVLTNILRNSIAAAELFLRRNPEHNKQHGDSFGTMFTVDHMKAALALSQLQKFHMGHLIPATDHHAVAELILQTSRLTWLEMPWLCPSIDVGYELLEQGRLLRFSSRNLVFDRASLSLAVNCQFVEGGEVVNRLARFLGWRKIDIANLDVSSPLFDALSIWQHCVCEVSLPSYKKGVSEKVLCNVAALLRSCPTLQLLDVGYLWTSGGPAGTIAAIALQVLPEEWKGDICAEWDMTPKAFLETIVVTKPDGSVPVLRITGSNSVFGASLYQTIDENYPVEVRKCWIHWSGMTMGAAVAALVTQQALEVFHLHTTIMFGTDEKVVCNNLATIFANNAATLREVVLDHITSQPLLADAVAILPTLAMPQLEKLQLVGSYNQLSLGDVNKILADSPLCSFSLTYSSQISEARDFSRVRKDFPARFQYFNRKKTPSRLPRPKARLPATIQHFNTTSV